MSASAPRARARKLYVWWGRRRVALDRLSTTDRLLFWAAILLAILALVVLFMSSIEVRLPGGVDSPAGVITTAAGSSCLEPTLDPPIPRLATILPLLGLCVATFTLLRGLATSRWRVLAGLIVGLVGAAFAASMVAQARSQETLRTIAKDLFPFVSWPSMVAGVLGLVATVLVLLSLVPRVHATLKRAEPWLAALPFALVLVLYAFSPVFGRPSQALVEQPCVVSRGVAFHFGALLDPRASMARDMQLIFTGLRFDAVVVPILAFWFVIEGTRTTRDIAGWVASRHKNHPAVWGLLLVPIAWLALGLTDTLPDNLGGGSPSWVVSQREGIVSWLLAIVFAGLLTTWIARRGTMVRERGLRAATWTFVLAFSAVTMVTTTILLIHIIELFLLPESSVESPVASVVAWLSDHVDTVLMWSWVCTILFALPVGLALLRSPQWRSVGVFVIAVGVWNAARAIGIAVQLLEGPPFSSRFPGTVEPMTIAATLFAALAGLMLASLTVRFRYQIDRELIVLFAVAFGLVTLAPTVVPDRLAEAAFSLTWGFPLIALLLWDAKDLNAAAGGPRVVPAVVSLGAGLLCLAASTAAVYGLSRQEVPDADAARLLLTIPFLTAVLLVKGSRRPSEDLITQTMDATRSAPGAREEPPSRGGADLG